MKVEHFKSLPFDANPQRLDPCIGRQYLALPLSRYVIGLWKVSSLTHPEPLGKTFELIELKGHSHEICALAFSNDSLKYLISACKEKLLLWDLMHENSVDISNRKFTSLPGKIVSLSLNNSNSVAAVGWNFSILLFKEDQNRPLHALEAHNGPVVKLAFCPHYSATLISISDDRSFCVWNTEDGSLQFRSTIISSAPLISLSMNWACPQVAIGTANGMLKVFDLTDEGGFRQLASIDVSTCLSKYKKTYTERNSTSCTSNNTENQTSVQSHESVLLTQYLYYAQDYSLSYNTHKTCAVFDVLSDKPPLLCVFTTSAIFYIHSKTYSPVDIFNLQEPIRSQTFAATKNIGPLAYAASCQTNSSNIVAVVGSVFNKQIEVLSLELFQQRDMACSNDHGKRTLNAHVNDDVISIVPTCMLLNSSPLSLQMLPPVAPKIITKGDVATGKHKSTSVMNQPLTFQRSVKSSGYAQTQRIKRFTPDTGASKDVGQVKQNKKKQEQLAASLASLPPTTYDATKGPPVERYTCFHVDHDGGSVVSLRYTDDGSTLACAMSNNFALALKSAKTKLIPTYFIGHDNFVNSVYWSKNGDYLLTSSRDRSVLLWDKCGGDPLLSMTHFKTNRTSSAVLSTTKSSSATLATSKLSSAFLATAKSTSAENRTFSSDIKHAQFFYVDTFILLTHGPQLVLYKYYVTHAKEDIKRYHSQNRYKFVASWQTPSSAFTATAAVNRFCSHLVICTTSGRNLEVYDLNKSVMAHVILDIHSRPAHSVTINESSNFSSQPPEAHNVVATAALTDPIKLWDLRSSSCIQSLTGHLNNTLTCQVAFSPCGNYLAAASENNMVYLFDIRKGTYLPGLRGHTESVTGLAFHPAVPVLATGSLNGQLIYFRSK